MKSSFPKRVKRHSSKWDRNGNDKFDYYLLKRAFHIHRNAYRCIYLFNLFQNMISEQGIAIATSICGLAFNAF